MVSQVIDVKSMLLVTQLRVEMEDNVLIISWDICVDVPMDGRVSRVIGKLFSTRKR